MALRREDLLTDWQSKLPSEIDPTTARIPALYAAAKNALSSCLELDEAKAWSDKSAALASYARQANDKSVRNLAQRIHLRAVARIGELLLQIPAAHGGWGDLSRSRMHVARAAGLTRLFTNRALAIARVPADEREAAIEGPLPPSPTGLADRAPYSATAPKHATVERSELYVAVSRGQSALWNFSAWTKRTLIPEGFRFNVDESKRVRARVAKARAWLDQIETCCSFEVPQK